MTTQEAAGRAVQVVEVAGPSPALLEHAQRYPRDVAAARKTIQDMALCDPETAAQMFYGLPRGGKTITGPSVRLAEMAQVAWQHVYTQTEEVVGLPDAHEFVTVEARAIDLQSNVAVSERVKRRILDKNGKRYSADMIQQTTNAARSVAFRNAVFRVIPRALIDPIFESAMELAQGKGAERLEQRRSKAISAFGQMGYTPEQICRALKVKAVPDIGQDELTKLQAYYSAIKEGTAEPTEIFGEPGAES